MCCKENCPQSTIGNDCKCGDLRDDTFLNCCKLGRLYYIESNFLFLDNSQNFDSFPYSSDETCTSPTNGGWSTWSDWTACFKGPNGNQIRERSRQCDNPEPANGGSYCPGNWKETEDCASQGISVHILFLWF